MCCGRTSGPAALSTIGGKTTMPLRQMKHKVGNKIFETKQQAFEYAAQHGGQPEKIIVETDQLVQVSPKEETPEPEPEIEETTEDAPKKRGRGRPAK